MKFCAKNLRILSLISFRGLGGRNSEGLFFTSSIFKMIVLSCLLFWGCGQEQSPLDSISVIINEKTPLLHNKNFLGTPTQDEYLEVESTIIMFKVDVLSSFDLNDLSFFKDNIEFKPVGGTKTLTLDNEKMSLKICYEGKCVTAFVKKKSRDSLSKKPSKTANVALQQSEERETKQLSKTVPRRSQERETKQVSKTVPRRSQERENNRGSKTDPPQSKERKIKRVSQTDPKPTSKSESKAKSERNKMDEWEFKNYQKTGYDINRNRCDNKEYTLDKGEIAAIAKENLELNSFYIIPNKNGRVKVSVFDESGNTIDQVTKLVIKDQPSEINFQHTRLILMEGQKYMIRLQSLDSEMQFENIKHCTAAMPSSEKLKLIPQNRDSHIFFNLNYKW